MSPRELHLERTPQPLRAPRAWLIDGADPARWLAEIARWQIAEDQLALHVLPRSRSDRSVGGLFVIAPAGVTPAVRPAALAFATIADRCWLPVDAVLRPAVTDAEVCGLCAPVPLMFHPALGPVAVDREAALRVADRLCAPGAVVKMWRAAPIIPRAHPRIETIAFRVTLSLGEIFGEESREIGKEPPGGLPRAPGEPSDHPLARGLRGIGHGMLSAAEWAINHLPGGKAADGMRDGISRWIGERLGGISREMALSRHHALLRLIEELKNNPEAGLRHALPLNHSALHRGIAPPTNRLGERGSDFDLKRLGGGQRRDAWDVPDDVRMQLRQRYLELAERERQLGRFRRAACIYAELLGDLHAAAAALAEGGHWQEAALVHRDHLHNAMEAARCFAEGRMYAEAVKIYEEKGAHEPLGALYRTLGDEEKAGLTFRKWIAELIAQGDILAAASVMETPLNAAGEAVLFLESAWDSTAQAPQCVERILATRGPRGEHAETVGFLSRIAASRAIQGLVPALLDVFAKAQTTYPDRGVRALAGDIGRRWIATRIAAGSGGRQAQFIQKLAGLAPDDRLLAQDGHRFLDQQRANTPPSLPRKSPPASIAKRGTAELTPLFKFRLPHPRTAWRLAAGCRDGLFAIGTDGGNVRAVRLSFDSAVQEVEWRHYMHSDITGNLILAVRSDDVFENAFAAVQGFGLLDEIRLPLTDAKIGLPTWVGNSQFAAAYSGDGTLWILHGDAEGYAIKGYADGGRLRGHIAVPPPKHTPDPKYADAAWPPLLAASGTELVLALGFHLHRFGGESNLSAHGAMEPIVFSKPITALAVPPRWGAPHVAVALGNEVQICWLGRQAGRCHLVWSGLDGAVIGYSADGTLVILSGSAGYLFDCDSRGNRHEARFAWPHSPAVAIVPGPTARTFGVVEADGQVHWLRFSSEWLR